MCAALLYLIFNWNHTIHPFIGEGISFYPGVVIAINLNKTTDAFRLKSRRLELLGLMGMEKLYSKKCIRRGIWTQHSRRDFFSFLCNSIHASVIIKKMTNTPPINTKWLLKRSLILSNQKYKGKLSDALVSKFVLNKVS